MQAIFGQGDSGELALVNVGKLGGKAERTPQLDGSDLIGITLGDTDITSCSAGRAIGQGKRPLPVGRGSDFGGP